MAHAHSDATLYEKYNKRVKKNGTILEQGLRPVLGQFGRERFFAQCEQVLLEQLDRAQAAVKHELKQVVRATHDADAAKVASQQLFGILKRADGSCIDAMSDEQFGAMINRVQDQRRRKVPAAHVPGPAIVAPALGLVLVAAEPGPDVTPSEVAANVEHDNFEDLTGDVNWAEDEKLFLKEESAQRRDDVEMQDMLDMRNAPTGSETLEKAGPYDDINFEEDLRLFIEEAGPALASASARKIQSVGAAASGLDCPPSPVSPEFDLRKI
ncbi:hypothetical protein JCM3775_005561 [Rhodotorula graminis]